MSAPAPAPQATTPFATRALLALVFAVVAFVAIWQAFGLVGFGTDLHTGRVFAALVPLFLCGLLFVRPKTGLVVRVVAALVCSAAAGYAWLEVRPASFKSAMSLRQAVQRRDWYKERLAVPTAEEAEQSDGLRGIHQLIEQYSSLCKELPAEYDRWAEAVSGDIAARYKKLPADDYKGADALVKPAKALAAAHPASAAKLDAALAVWRTGALLARVGELNALPLGDWEAFNRTAFGRRALVEALPDARDALFAAEAEWVDASVQVVVRAAVPKAGGPPTREFWKRAHWDVLALKSLDTDDRRFLAARGRLFKAAHDGTKLEALKHFENGDEELAFGVARAHAVEWSNTATLLGNLEQNLLAELRSTYEFFAALAAKSARPLEVAPQPRVKP